MHHDGYSAPPNVQYGSMQISNGGAGSDLSSPEENLEVSYIPGRFQVLNNSFFESKQNSRVRVRYHECQKNHAASIGGHAVDGCGEFFPGGKEGTIEALTCAACHCHRNFHRREILTRDICVCGGLRKPQAMSSSYSYDPPARPISPLMRESKRYHFSSSADISPHGPVDFPLSRFEDDEDDEDEPPQQLYLPSSAKKKRFRTKFTPEQKDKMFHFAERLGWRISKNDEGAVDAFCNEVGVKRNVFKVWMHNNIKRNPRNRQCTGSELDTNCSSPPGY
ncbi:hypothetical protein KP509_17G065600 [Ceratopteris richardii]|uniref:ZF-HD dimerization-type domain-containing protein n=1 Tax=Ceratopteris richardii TaxID=49495 RepID=A0A8T2SXQ2_CERRI|nr:hypothetical protein KP509_17G065600 [Ceratopteris richardii]KAH7373624.1 hypothetical protein KP509_17G065600 [Ceratopteris richardii]KAH7373625.1 hypothetical protein KP509_17G065600 [Ceratopteris richardii]